MNNKKETPMREEFEKKHNKTEKPEVLIMDKKINMSSEEEMQEKRENLAIALCDFGEYVKWFNDNVFEIPVVGSMERPIVERYKYDANGHVLTYPSSDDIIGFDVLDCCRYMDKVEAECLPEDECIHWYDYVYGAYSAL